MSRNEWNRKHPDVPDCVEAHQYWVLVDDSKRAQLRNILAKETRCSADLDPTDAIKLMPCPPGLAPPSQRMSMDATVASPLAAGGGGSIASGSGVEQAPEVTPEETPEEKAAREKAEKAARLKELRDKAAKDPMVQKQKWLKGATDLVAKLKEKIAEAKKVKLPNGMEKTYETTFTTTSKEIKEIREFLESKQSKKAVKTKLDSARTIVDDINKDIKAFDGLCNTYVKS